MDFASAYCQEFAAEARTAYGLDAGPWHVVSQGLSEGEGADDGIRYGDYCLAAP